jgi:hypothetical protein
MCRETKQTNARERGCISFSPKVPNHWIRDPRRHSWRAAQSGVFLSAERFDAEARIDSGSFACAKMGPVSSIPPFKVKEKARQLNEQSND